MALEAESFIEVSRVVAWSLQLNAADRAAYCRDRRGHGETGWNDLANGIHLRALS